MKIGVVNKLAIAFILLTLGVLAFLGMILSQMFEDFYMSLQADDMVRKGEIVGNILKQTKDPDQALLYARVLSLESEMTVTLTDGFGRIIGCTNHTMFDKGAQVSLEEMQSIQQGQILIRQGYSQQFKNAMLSVVVPVMRETRGISQVTSAVFLYAPLEPISETIDQLRKLIISSALITILIASLLAIVFSRRIADPLVKINEVATQMTEGNFAVRVAHKGEDEIGKLGDTLNVLANRLEDSLGSLSREKDLLQNVISSMTDGVVSLDHNGQISLFNPPAKEVLNLNDNSEGKDIRVCCPNENILKLYEQVLNDKSSGQTEAIIENKIIAVGMAPLYELNKTLSGVVMVIQDITKGRELEEMRKEFVANVSHELRTPLCLIQGYTEALQEGMADDANAREELLSIITDETQRMQKLVQELLDLARIESGKAELEIMEIEVNQFFKDIVYRFSRMAQEKSIELTQKVSSPSLNIKADPHRLAQILINLVDNAVKYSNSNSTIYLEASEQGQGIAFTVRDQGPGIPPEQVPYVFERFHKVDKSRNRQISGTGLGLAIVRSLVESHGGWIKADSELGKGTTFTFWLPSKLGG